MDDIISKTFRRLEEQYGHIEGSLDSLPQVVANFLRIHAAQGVIDNGGYPHFFDSDWPGHPPYSRFIEAYLAIGCEEQAREIERVIATFPFDNPHLHEDDRKKYMGENYDDEKDEVRGWGDALCGDKRVWEKLADYCIEHQDELA